MTKVMVKSTIDTLPFEFACGTMRNVWTSATQQTKTHPNT